VKAR